MAKLLDLFCGAGGAAMGYHLAGFADITGVDHVPQPHFPFRFIQADALEYLAQHGPEYDVIHASPPCQAYSIMRHLPWLRHKDYPKLIAPVQELLRRLGRPYILENVMGAKLDAGWLCGGMFGLPLYRHRAFATNWLWLQPAHPAHTATIRPGPYLGERARAIGYKRLAAQAPGSNGGHAAGVSLAQEAMQIDWMTRDELAQAIPPAYTQWIGHQLLAQGIVACQERFLREERNVHDYCRVRQSE
jgi:DNA (cytosine-5)-methyltransferase 1